MLGFCCSTWIGLFWFIPPYLLAAGVVPKNGNWAEWSCFTDCSKSCGEGTQTRRRTCTDPAPAFGGADCCGPSQQVLSCNFRSCPQLTPTTITVTTSTTETPTTTTTTEPSTTTTTTETATTKVTAVPTTVEITTVPPLPPECRNVSPPVDIQFLLDSSQSVRPTNFVKVKQFVRSFAQTFEIGPNDANIGVVTFDKLPRNQFWLNEYTDKSSLLLAINRIPDTVRMGSQTAKGLEFVRTQALTKEHGNRDDASDILIVVTDGQSVPKQRTLMEAGLLHSTSITVLAVGVGNDVDGEELADIASNPSYVFQVTNFDNLTDIVHTLQGNVCEVPSA